MSVRDALKSRSQARRFFRYCSEEEKHSAAKALIRTQYLVCLARKEAS